MIVTHGRMSHRVEQTGSGPPVVLMHEVTGAGPTLLALASELAEAGYRVYTPVFYGDYGRNERPAAALLKARFCLWRQLHLFATNRTSPLVRWLRHLVDVVTDECGFDAAAVIGMCMTGGLVFGTLGHSVSAAVAAQPSLPFAPPIPGIRRRFAASVGLGSKDLQTAKDSRTPLLVVRYEDDRLTPDERLDTVRHEFGENCELTTNNDGVHVNRCGRTTTLDLPGSRHATLTRHRHPTAVSMVLEFLADHHPNERDPVKRRHR